MQLKLYGQKVALTDADRARFATLGQGADVQGKAYMDRVRYDIRQMLIVERIPKLKDLLASAEASGDLYVEAIASHELGKWLARPSVDTSDAQLAEDTSTGIKHLTKAFALLLDLGETKNAASTGNILSIYQAKAADWIRWRQNSKAEPNLQPAIDTCKLTLELANPDEVWEEFNASLTWSALQLRCGDIKAASKGIERAASLIDEFESNDIEKAQLLFQKASFELVGRADVRSASDLFDQGSKYGSGNSLLDALFSVVRVFLRSLEEESLCPTQTITATFKDSQLRFHELRCRDLAETTSLKQLVEEPWRMIDCKP